MVENFEAIKELTSEDLAFAKKMLNFFALVGISQSDLKLLFELVKSQEKIIKTMNQIIADQKAINQRLDSLTKAYEDLKSKGGANFKKDKYDPIAELNKTALMFNKEI